MNKEQIDLLHPEADFMRGRLCEQKRKAADALEAKAAPVGEREAYIAWYRDTYKTSPVAVEGGSDFRAYQAGAAYQRAQQPQSAEVFMYATVLNGKVQRTGSEAHCREWADAWNSPETESCAEVVPLYTTPQPSAEAVAWLDPVRGLDWLVDRMTVAPGTKLYTTPQPSAGVVMLEQCAKWCDEQAASDWHGRTASDMVREFARLNGKEVGRG